MSDGPDTRYVRAILRSRAEDDVAAGRRIIPVFARDFLWLLNRVDELEAENADRADKEESRGKHPATPP